MHRADFALGLLFGAAFAYVLFEVQGMRWQAALGPGLAASAGLVLVVMHLLSMARQDWRDTGAEIQAKMRHYGKDDLLAMAGFLASVALVLLLGFAVGGTLFVVAAVLIATRGKFVMAVLLAAPVYPFFAIAIERGLGIVMFDGLLWGWLG